MHAHLLRGAARLRACSRACTVVCSCDGCLTRLAAACRELTLPIAKELGVPIQNVFANRMNWQVGPAARCLLCPAPMPRAVSFPRICFKRMHCHYPRRFVLHCWLTLPSHWPPLNVCPDPSVGTVCYRNIKPCTKDRPRQVSRKHSSAIANISTCNRLLCNHSTLFWIVASSSLSSTSPGTAGEPDPPFCPT
jgi:hypothetical protein